MASRTFRIVATALAAVVYLVFAPSAAGAPAQGYVVPHSYLAGLQAELARPGQAPPGANNWNCRPTGAHPEPVILLHGFVSSSQLTWQTLSSELANAHYCVFALDYGQVAGIGGLRPVETSADELAGFVHRVLAATGAHQVDLVGHSEGATMPFYNLDHDAAASHSIRRYVSLAALNRGTTQDGMAPLIQAAIALPGAGPAITSTCGPCGQLLAGSPFITALSPSGTRYPAIEFTNIVTRYDQIATPYTTGLLAGRNVTNIVLQDRCPVDYSDHLELPSDPVAARIVLNALDPAHAAPVPCMPVAPFVGPV